MRLHIVESKNSKSLYVIKSVYFNKKRTSKVVEKLGTYDELKKKLNEKYTSHQIITTLKELNVLEKLEQGHIPLYTRTDSTNDLHDKFRFRTDYQIITDAKIKKILKNTKK